MAHALVPPWEDRTGRDGQGLRTLHTPRLGFGVGDPSWGDGEGTRGEKG